MAIYNELSSDIATALLTGKEKDPRALDDLKETVIKVHSTLQKLAADSRRRTSAFGLSQVPEIGTSNRQRGE
jgi:hypothetical protein